MTPNASGDPVARRLSTGGRTPDRLVRAATAVIVLSCAFTIATSWWAWRSARDARGRSRVAAERLAETWLRDYLEISTEHAYRTWFRMLIPALVASPTDPQRALDALWRAAAPDACRCGALAPSFVFRADARGRGVLVAAGGDTVGMRVATALVDASRDVIAAAAADPLRLHAASDSGPAAVWLLEFVKAPSRDGAAGVLGFGVRIAALAGAVFAPAHDSLRRAYGRHAAPATEAFTIRVTDRTGAPVYASGPPADDAPAAHLSYWDDERPAFRASLAINPAALNELLPGGIPTAPWSPLLGAVLVSLALGASGVLLLRRARLAAADRERFTASVSHELRTPLTKILIYAETLEMGRAGPQQAEQSVRIIAREARHLVHLIDDVLEAARGPRAPRTQPPSDVAAVVRHCVRDAAPLARDRGAHLDVVAEDELSASADAGALRHVVSNLITNALRHGPDGQTVTVSVTRDASDVLIRVADQGPGIPAGDRERIWEPYNRTTPARTADGGGVGLGLTIARQLARGMSGSVELVDGVGLGAVFVVRLPAAPASKASADAAGVAVGGPSPAHGVPRG